jgi:hypothetical protein
MPEIPNERLSALNSWVSSAVVDGNRAYYDRTTVLSPGHTGIEFNEKSATVSIPSVDALRKQFEKQEGSEPIGGTCRELAQWAAVSLLKEGMVDSAEVYACATDSEAHYVVVAELDGQKYLVDIAYSQPVLEAIPVDGENHVSRAFSGQRGTKQAFSGEITYTAAQKEDGSILFKVNSPSRSTEFPLCPLTNEVDAKIPGKWATATGSGYATKVRPNGDGTYRVDSEPMGTEATLQDEFKRLHDMAKQFGDSAIKVVFEN